jgi:predicted GNAT family N-acyltransferase
MELLFEKLTRDDSEKIHELQVISFKALLDKYQDYETNPGAETLERIKQRFDYPQVDHYFTKLQGEIIGYIRIAKQDEATYSLSQMFILPNHRGKGYAQQTILQAELLYPQAKSWSLDTIKQESKLCHIYEKMGYRQTGETKQIKDGMDIVFYRKELAE